MKILEPLRRAVLGGEAKSVSPRAVSGAFGGFFGRGANDHVRSLPDAYQQNGWVFTAVNVLAGSAASVPLVLKRTTPDPEDADETIGSNPALVPIVRPNPKCTQREYREARFAWRALSGNVFEELVRNAAGKVVERWILPSDRVRIVPNEDGTVRGYLLTVGGRTIRFDAEDVMHDKTFNPKDDWYGQPILQAVRNALEASIGAQKTQRLFFKHGMVTSGALVTEQSLTTDDQKDLREQFESVHAGQDRWWRPMVLHKGLKWEQHAAKMSDVPWEELTSEAKDEILSVFGVTPVMGRDYENLNFATATQQEKSFWTTSVVPMVEREAESLGIRYLPNFADVLQYSPATDPEAVYFEPDFSVVKALSAVNLEEEQAHQVAINSSTMTPNEVRRRRGDAPYEDWGDEPLVPINMIPASTAKEAAIEYAKALAAVHAKNGEGATIGLHADASPGPDPAVKALPPGPVPSLGEEERQKMIWKRFERSVRERSRPMLAAVRRWFQSQEDRVLNRLQEQQRRAQAGDTTKAPAAEDLIDVEQEAEAFVAAMNAPARTMIADAGSDAFEALGLDADLFDDSTDEVARYLGARYQADSAIVVETTLEQLAGVLERAADEGLSDEETVAAVKAKYAQIREGRATVIADNSTSSTINFAQDEAFKQSGVVEGEEWLAAFVPDTREEHAAAHGQIVKLGESFEVGGEQLEYPGDPSGSAAMTINCLCTTAPVVDVEALEARGITFRNQLFKYVRPSARS